MGRLLVLFLMMPWWAYIPASIGVVWIGEQAYSHALETEAEKAAALEADMPAPVDLGEFRKDRDLHAARELHVTGWIDPALNYELVKSRNGIPTDTRYLYMLFGADDPEGAREVRAALMLTETERDTFLDQIDDHMVGLTDAGKYILAFNGFGSETATLGDMARDAMEEKGRAKAAGFIFVEPFLEGREAALAPQGVPDTTRTTFWLIAGVVALIGVGKRVMSLRARPRAIEPAEPDTATAPPPADVPADPPDAPARARGLRDDGVDADTPLGRLARRRPSAETPPAPVPDPVPSLADETGLGRDPLALRRAADRLSARDPAIDPAPKKNRLVFDSAADPAAGSPLKRPSGDAGAEPAAAGPADAARGSDMAFYTRLALAMLVVGWIAYKPAILGLALPYIGVALFWLGVYVAYQKLRSASRTSANRVLRSARRRTGGAQPVAAGVGGHQVDIAAPVQSSRERGVI